MFPTSGFLQISPHGEHPCLRLYPSHYRVDSGLAPVRNVRRRAHNEKRNCNRIHLCVTIPFSFFYYPSGCLLGVPAFLGYAFGVPLVFSMMTKERFCSYKSNLNTSFVFPPKRKIACFAFNTSSSISPDL